MTVRAVDTAGIDAAFMGRYEVLEKVGEGGFGDVYKARQRATGQTVAIKVLRIPEAQPEEHVARLIARFEREARLCAQLYHPNIVRLMDSGKAEDRSVYSVFEFVPGKTLGAVLAEERRLHPVEARHLMSQILDALACAHAQGVVHRDLKPANIMVVPTGARRNAIVLDFGIGALIDGAGPGEIRITRSHEWVGTPIYAAPEQIRGQRPSPRADLYSWGLIFLECLTGQRPIRGDAVADVVYQQLSPEPILIPARIAVHPLGRVLRRATEKALAARDVTADGLLRELEACDVSGPSLDEPAGVAPTPGLSDTTATAQRDRDASTRADVHDTAHAPTAALRPSEGERRQVTALCCTLSMVSDAPGRVELDELDPLLEAEQDACAVIARRFGGHVVGALNETMLFFFGYPAAREDDARRAARAALAIVAEVHRRSATIAEGHAAHVEIRAGAHTGMIVAQDLQSPAGQAPSRLGGATSMTASRLCALAQPGEILISKDTHRLLRGRFLFEGRGVLASGGASMDAYRLLEGAAEQGGEDIPLVGRQRELDLLFERWAHARGGAGQAALITGEPGIGKSRLTRALRKRIGAEPHTYIEGRCAPDATNSPLYPIIDTLDRLLDPGRERLAEAKTERLAELLSRHGFELAEAMPLFAPLLSLPLPAPYAPLEVSPQKQRELTYNAVLSLFFEMSERAPVLLVIEDLHWADPSTLELCAALVSEASSGRILALFTGRPEFSPAWSPSTALFVQLGHLDMSDVARMAAAVSGGRALPPGLCERIAARTDGVPLFIEELIQMMLESGSLVEREGRLVLTGVLDDLRIPSTLRGSLAARLDRLGGARETAQVAAAIGREFGFDLLRAVLPGDEGKLREDLDKLVAADLVHRKRRLRSPAYVFKHALVQDTAYDAMPKGRRREIHERIARALERELPAVTEEQPELLARHFERASLPSEATAYLVKAGQHAIQRSAFVEATTLLSHGIDVVARAAEAEWALRRELELRVLLGTALMASRGYCAPEFEANGQKARALCGRLGDPPEIFQVIFALWEFSVLRGDHPEAAASQASELLAIAERHASTGPLIAAEHARGVTLFYSQHIEEARAAFYRVVSLYDVAMHRYMVQTYGDDQGLFAHAFLQHVALASGDAGEALRHVARTRDLAKELGNPFASTVAAVFTMSAYHILGDRARMAAEAEEALRLATKHGFSYWEMTASFGHGLALVRRGEVEAGLARLRGGMSLFEQNGNWTTRPHWTLFMVEALFLARRSDEALRLIDETVAGAAGKLDQGSVPSLLGMKAASLAAGGDLESAIALYRRALAMIAPSGNRSERLHVSAGLARALLGAGRREEARGCLSDALSGIRDGEGMSSYEEGIKLLASLS